jgi:hypothetical protein
MAAACDVIRASIWTVFSTMDVEYHIYDVSDLLSTDRHERWLSSSGRWRLVALIRTDVSEDALLKVPLFQTPHSSNPGLFTRYTLGVVFLESPPIQELTVSLCTCSHSFTLKTEAIRSSETSVLIRATRRHLPEDDNHHSRRRGNLKLYAYTLFRISMQCT